MKCKINFKVLERLFDKPKVTSLELLEVTGLSKKQLNEEINLLSDELRYCAKIDYNEQTQLYFLTVFNYVLFKTHYRYLGSEQVDSLNQQERVRLILIILLSQKEYVKIEELADELYVSTRQISKDMQMIREILKKHDISIKSIPHYGLEVQGTELKKRICLADIYSKNVISLHQDDSVVEKNHREMIDTIRSIVSEILYKYEYTISDIMFENLIIHLFVTILRIRSGYEISIDDETASETIELLISKEIIQTLGNTFHLNFNKDEHSYIVAHLESKRSYTEGYSENIPPEIGDIVVEFLSRIDMKYHTKFRSDFQLCMILSMHCMSLVNRIKYGLTQKNPLLEEIKAMFMYEFELAIEGSKAINEAYECELDENEIGYFALDIRLCLEKRNKEAKYNVLLVCSTGRGSAELLRLKIMESFDNFIDKLTLCSSREIDKLNLDEFHYVFTTVPLFVKAKTPILRISCFLGDQDMLEIRGILKSNDNHQEVLKYFEKDLFMGLCDFKNKQDALEQMVNHIREHKDIPDNFLDCVLARESEANTSFGNKVAFPHPNELLTEETFVCIAVLNKPIIWGTTKVQIIFLASIENTSVKNLQDFYKMLAKVINNSSNIEQLLQKPTYNTLETLLFKEQ